MPTPRQPTAKSPARDRALTSSEAAIEYLERNRSPHEISMFGRALAVAEAIIENEKRIVAYRDTMMALMAHERRLAELGGTTARISDHTNAPEHRNLEYALHLMYGDMQPDAGPDHDPAKSRLLALAIIRLSECRALDGLVAAETVAFVLATICARLEGTKPPSHTEMAVAEVATKPSLAVSDAVEIDRTFERWKKRKPGKKSTFDAELIYLRAVSLAHLEQALHAGGTAGACAGVARQIAERHAVDVGELALVIEEDVTRFLLMREEALATGE